MAIGNFVWRDNMTPDVAKVLPFYEGLFGWTYTQMPTGPGSSYNIFNVDGFGLGGFTALDPAQGAPPHWASYIQVADVDATVEKSASLGATTLMSPTDIPTVGRFAVLTDPLGAVVMPISFTDYDPDTGAPASGTPGTVAWNELTTTDVAKEIPFYEGLFGYSHRTTPMGASGDYIILQNNGKDIAGVMQNTPQMPPITAWTIYFEVADVEASHARVKELGGTNATDIMDVPGVGRFSIAVDPAGAVFALFQGSGL